MEDDEVLPTDPTALIHPSVQPREGEPVIAKHRTSAFSGSAFEMVLRAENIETLILMGHATSGVILSTVRLAADLDYNLIVVEDGCADRDPEVHSVLTEKVFPRQGTVVSSREMVEALQQAGERVWSSIDSGVAESVDELSPQTFPDFEQ